MKTKQQIKAEIDALQVEYDAVPEGAVDYATWRPEDGELSLTHTIIHHFATLKDYDTFKKVNERFHELMDGVVLDWNSGEKKWFVLYDHDNKCMSYDASRWECQAQGVNYMTLDVSGTMRKEFTDAELKLWVLGGARR